ncbi:hypothetical protein DSM25559_3510 [Agrobacterium rosae]|uniref:Uncharacterized protein n=1 Tax=Agrobacterium rosae TaxID=1972867 RepID=A0A1R3TVZ7_9HYPH|nr:hypothetical protein DSM25559_3510 [Agrobacterium rosae]
MAAGSEWLVVVTALLKVVLENLTQFNQNNNCKKSR